MNDERIARGEPPLEAAEKNRKVLVWPDLVYTELIAMVVATVVLVAWSVLLRAPLEEPANAARTPNPSKAPWYFLGLQEMLVYFDPWWPACGLPGTDHDRPDRDPVRRPQPEGQRLLHAARAQGARSRSSASASSSCGCCSSSSARSCAARAGTSSACSRTGTSTRSAELNNVNLSEIVWVKLLGHAACRTSGSPREIWGFLRRGLLHGRPARDHRGDGRQEALPRARARSASASSSTSGCSWRRCRSR